MATHTVKSFTAVANQFLTQLDDDGTFHSAAVGAGAITSGWPAATDVLVSTGTTTAPGGDPFFTADTSNHILNAMNCVLINGVSAGSNQYLIGGATNNGNRDRVQLFVGSGSQGATGTGDNTFVEIIPIATNIRAGVSAGKYATLRVENLTYTGISSPTITEAASLYIDGAPGISAATGSSYAVHVAAGTTRLGGLVDVDTLNTGGMVKAAASTGELDLAVAGTDYMAPTTKHDYFMRILSTPLALQSGEWVATSNDQLFGTGLTVEYPNDFKATHASIKMNIISNVGVGGNITVSLTLNGSTIAASNITIVAGVTTGLQTVSTFSTGSASASDTFGLFLIQAAGATGLQIVFTYQVVLVP
jgi:hypothetical protein